MKYSHPIAVAYNGGYRYKMGNFFYSEIVKQYVDFNGGTDGGDNKPLQPKGLESQRLNTQKDRVSIYIVALEKMLGSQVMSLIQKCHI